MFAGTWVSVLACCAPVLEPGMPYVLRLTLRMAWSLSMAPCHMPGCVDKLHPCVCVESHSVPATDLHAMLVQSIQKVFTSADTACSGF